MVRTFLYNPNGSLKKRSLALLGIGLLVSTAALSLILINTIRHSPKLADVENELAEIAPPPGAATTQHISIYKWTSGTVGNYYQSNLTYDQLRAYYDVELARHGWKFHKQVPLKDWGKDLGESQTLYCKGDRAVDIYWTGNAPQNYRYALNITWGWPEDCD